MDATRLVATVYAGLVIVLLAAGSGIASPRIHGTCVEHPTDNRPYCFQARAECWEVYVLHQLKRTLKADVPFGSDEGLVLGEHETMYGYFRKGNGGSIFTGFGELVECYAGMASKTLEESTSQSPLSNPSDWLVLLERVARGEVAWDEVAATLPATPPPPT